MNIYYFYLTLLLLMFILIYYGISYSLKFAPLKIKVLSFVALASISFRYLSLIILLVARNINYLYLLKPFVFLNLMCIPALAIASIYIFARNDKIKFNYCLIIGGLFVAFYAAAVIKFPVYIEAYENLGYIMAFNSRNIQYGVYIIVNTIFFFLGIIFLGNKNTNKPGMWLVAISALTIIIELMTRAIGIVVFPSLLIGDILWIITIDRALYKLKR